MKKEIEVKLRNQTREIKTNTINENTSNRNVLFKYKKKKGRKKAFARNQFGSEFISPLDFAVFIIMFSVLQCK